MDWLDIVGGAQAVRAVFGVQVPSLEVVRVYEVVFRQDGPSIVLKIDLSEYPTNPPTKWQSAGDNTVRLELVLDAVTRVLLDGWSVNNVGRLDIRRSTSTESTVEFVSEDRRFQLDCRFPRVGKISAYCNATRIGPSHEGPVPTKT